MYRKCILTQNMYYFKHLIVTFCIIYKVQFMGRYVHCDALHKTGLLVISYANDSLGDKRTQNLFSARVIMAPLMILVTGITL
jgi:hypothetical protein